MNLLDMTKGELIELIHELRKEKAELEIGLDKERRLQLSWAGNLGNWYWNYKTNEVTFNLLKVKALGYSEDEIPKVTNYQFFTDKLHTEDYEAVMDSMRRLLKGESDVYEVEYRILCKDGQWKWFYDRGKIVQRDEDNTPLMIAGIVFDISEQKNLECGIRREKERAEKESKEKSMFLANMSHEIRTPMNGIIGFLQLLENTYLNNEQIEYVNIIKNSAEILHRLVNDILDLSKIEAGKYEVESVEYDLYQAVETAVRPFTKAAEDKGLEMKVLIDQGVPRHVVGDATKLKQVIMNLVNNAVKFTERGTVSVEVNAKSSKGSQQEIEFIIKDTGIGISEQAVERLFKPFAQADASLSRRYGGTGLGITISKSLIELMGGNIMLESKEGEGSTFTFSIIVGTAVQQKLSKKQLQGVEVARVIEEKSYKDIRILVAEDNDINRKFFLKMLRAKGLNCDLVVNGKEAIEACTKKKYDLIFMDCQMPVMDGYECTKLIRQAEGNKRNTPLIATTAFAMNEEKERCLMAGMDDYLAKPLKIDMVMNMITKYASRKEADTKVDNLNSLIERLMNDTGFDRNSAEELLMEAIPEVMKVVTEVELYIKEKKQKEVLDALHQLKGTSGNLRMEAVHQEVLRAEEVAKIGELDMLGDILNQIRKMLEELL